VTPVVRAIVISCAVVFIAQLAFPGTNASPGLTDFLTFSPERVRYYRWTAYTAVTYMFAHGGIAHIGFNLFTLYFFGPKVEAQIGSRRFTILYFISGISGAVLSFFLAPNAALVGASAGIFGVMLAFARYWPEATIMLWMVIPIPAWLLVILTTIMEFWFGRTGMESGVAHFAHLGGYAGAALYLIWLERTRKAFKRSVDRVSPEIAQRVQRWEGVDLARIHEVNRAEVARILDKITKSGVGSLTSQERLFLSNFVPWDDQAGSQVH